MSASSTGRCQLSWGVVGSTRHCILFQIKLGRQEAFASAKRSDFIPLLVLKWQRTIRYPRLRLKSVLKWRWKKAESFVNQVAQQGGAGPRGSSAPACTDTHLAGRLGERGLRPAPPLRIPLTQVPPLPYRWEVAAGDLPGETSDFLWWVRKARKAASIFLRALTLMCIS